MKIDIWSDVMCPFCYLGMHTFAKALATIPERERIELVLRSYQLQPNARHQPGVDVITSDAAYKGIPRDQVAKTAAQIEGRARSLGITIAFDRVQKANTFAAHRLIHLAATHDLAVEMEQRLFRAYFSEGKVLSEHSTLVALGVEAGLADHEIEQMLDSDLYTRDVRRDLAEARERRIDVIPFFLFNGRQTLAGVRSLDVYTNQIRRSFAEWEAELRV